MAKNSKIEWTTHTFNPWRGCAKVSEGCRNCYAARDAKRNPAIHGVWGPNGTRVVASESMWSQPLKWDRAAAAIGDRLKIFVASYADVFEDWSGVMQDHRGVVLPHAMDDVRARLFGLIGRTPNLDWLLLTKRPENISPMMRVISHGADPDLGSVWDELGPTGRLSNVWVGTTVENQEQAAKRVPELLRVPAAVRFLSCEPLLGPVDLSRWLPESCGCGGGPLVNDAKCPDCGERAGMQRSIDWVIVGGESGPAARPMHPDWARSLRDQCVAEEVPFFFKQWGEWLPEDQHFSPLAGPGVGYKKPKRVVAGAANDNDAADLVRPVQTVRVGKSDAGRLLDDREWSQFPKGVER